MVEFPGRFQTNKVKKKLLKKKNWIDGKIYENKWKVFKCKI
jgi:hypothetical protein